MAFRCCIYLALAARVSCSEPACSAAAPGVCLIQTRVKRRAQADRTAEREPIVRMPTRTTMNFEQDLGTCALVGSSSLLSGKGRGPDIDRHDTVIRVNRVPTPAFFGDFGNKTSIFFGNTYVRRGSVQLFGGAKQPVFRNNRGLFSRLVMNSWIPPPNWTSVSKVWRDAPYPVGYVADWVMRYAFAFTASHPLPTAGLFALLTFAPVCDRLDIYGFGGLDTADHHVMNVYHAHDINAEHALIDRIANNTLTESDISGRDMTRAKELRSFVAKLRGKIVRLAY
mmetsp:Transcript_75753/g.214136  ORF Transcript_75753/g.214136 Transcript_75753/m.214136 type:complete len:282 (-) Transcript_75753:104-949(-)